MVLVVRGEAGVVSILLLLATDSTGVTIEDAPIPEDALGAALRPPATITGVPVQLLLVVMWPVVVNAAPMLEIMLLTALPLLEQTLLLLFVVPFIVSINL